MGVCVCVWLRACALACAPLSTAPVVFSVDPPTAPISGGNLKIRVLGAHFGAHASGQRVLIGDKPCLKTEYASAQELRCIVPPGMGANKTVVVEVGDMISPANFTGFSYEGASLSLPSRACRAAQGSPAACASPPCAQTPW